LKTFILFVTELFIILLVNIFVVIVLLYVTYKHSLVVSWLAYQFVKHQMRLRSCSSSYWTWCTAYCSCLMDTN